MNRQVLLLATATLVRLCAGQASGWIANQVNTTMCYWTSPRAGVIRDTLYLDGGLVVWSPGMSDGTLGAQIADSNPLGLVYTLNFNTPFKTSDNITAIFKPVSKAAGNGAANNIAPNYVDGGMFTNDYQWITYGGLAGLTDAFGAQPADQVASFNAYSRNLPNEQFTPGYSLRTLNAPTTRYLTTGAYASAPSENIGWVFGGLRAENFGPIYQSPGRRNASLNADVDARTFISVDMTNLNKPTWTNTTLPTAVPGRASAELVWIPVSGKGVLVAVGGATHPSYQSLTQTNNATINALSKAESPKFVSTVSVYDVESNAWYEQDTTNAPPGALAQGCSVVASASDGSSHNIYWYGGFDGISPTADFNDDVWVLSIPSFIWTRVTAGTASHARAGHKCVKPYPDQMLVVGGYASLGGQQTKCVEKGVIQVYNLNTASWVDSYDPTVWSDYEVPAAVVAKIGGTGKGGATQTAPAKGFSGAKLAGIFGTKYDTAKIKTWYPYTPAESPNNTSPVVPLPKPESKGSGTPSYLAPVLGVVLGLFFITLLVLAFLLWRRRKYMKTSTAGARSESGTVTVRNNRVSNWLRNTPNDAKAPTVTTEETEETYPTSPYDYEEDRPHMHEVAGTQVHELMDTSRAAEIDGTNTGFVPMANRHHKPRRGASNASRNSSVSRDSSVRPPISPLQGPRADSPSLGDPRILSGVSDVSHTDRGHLRGISETSVSTDGNPEERLKALVSPITPPETANLTGDYLGARSSGSQRKSQFSENIEEIRK